MPGASWTGPSPATSIVFQDHGLFPWMTVQRNVEFNLKARGVARRRAAAVARRRCWPLTGLEAVRRPLSAPAQRAACASGVGIARALTTRPRALLMDEPFGALDAQTRDRLQQELLDIWARQSTTVLFVTHSIDEAITLADRILVFTPRPGRLAADVPLDLVRPRDPRSPECRAIAARLRDALGTEAHGD